jgi:hypothetical protein
MRNKKTVFHNHNKKRNVGMIYEFLIQYMTRKLVENDNVASDKAFKILKKHYKKSSVLYKEFRLFNSLITTTTSSEGIASRILREAKRAVLAHDNARLDKEKSLLIREINHTLSDSNFYKQNLKDYRLYATVQCLINDWKKPCEDNVIRVAEYEDEIVQWLIKEKAEVQEEKQYSEADRFVIKLMTEKFNKKYSGSITDEQQKLLKLYAFSEDTSAANELMSELKCLSAETKMLIEDYCVNNTSDNYVAQKLNSICESVGLINLSELSDSDMSTFLMLFQLNKELTSIKEKKQV